MKTKYTKTKPIAIFAEDARTTTFENGNVILIEKHNPGNERFYFLYVNGVNVTPHKINAGFLTLKDAKKYAERKYA